MAEGTKTFEGLSVPLFGESEIQAQTAATDILTITSAASHTGDFLVLQNSTGAELFVISSSGLITSVVGASFTGPLSFSGVVTATLSSTTAASAFAVSVTSTGAIAQGANGVNAILVSASSKSVLNSVIGYNSGGGSEVGTCETFFAVHGSKAPTNFISVGATGAGTGAATANGFFSPVGTRLFTAATSTATAISTIKILAGSKAHYIIAYPDTLFT